MERSGSGILAIASSTALAPSALFASAFSSLARSFIAARSSGVKPFDVLPAVLFPDLRVAFFAGFLSGIDKTPPCAKRVPAVALLGLIALHVISAESSFARA